MYQYKANCLNSGDLYKNTLTMHNTGNYTEKSSKITAQQQICYKIQYVTQPTTCSSLATAQRILHDSFSNSSDHILQLRHIKAHATQFSSNSNDSTYSSLITTTNTCRLLRLHVGTFNLSN